jgi:hypothetical protein
LAERLRTERAATIFAFASALGILAAWVAARAARDALFLSTFPVEALPRMMLAAAVVSLGSAVGLARLLARYGPSRVIPVAFAISAALFLGEWVLTAAEPSLAPVALYLHLGALGALLISGFFSVLNERWDPYTAKTVVARAGAFGALGLVVGGLAAERAAVLAGGVAPLLLGLAFAHALCALGIVGIGAPKSSSRQPGATGESGLAILRRTSLLRNMAMLAALIAATETLLDYALKSAAAERFPNEESLFRFFALFEMSVGAVAFLLQFSVGGRFLHRFGLGWAMAVRPALVMLASIGGAVFSRFATVVLARAADVVSLRSTYSAGFELLYTSLPLELKRPSKPFVDVVANRAGDIAGAALILLLLALLPSLPRPAVLAITALISGVALLLIARIQTRYVNQLASNLKAGAISLDTSEMLDAVTTRTVFGSRSDIDRDDLMAQIEAARAGQAKQRAVSDAADTARADDSGLAHSRKELFDRIEGLESGDPARVRATLNAARGDLRLVQHVIPLLRDGASADPALVFLRAVAPQVVGQLTDAFVDPDQDVGVRRRLPRVLELSRTARSVDGLCLGLLDGDFEVRLGCARAAARIIAREPELRLPVEQTHGLAAGELAHDWGNGAAGRASQDDPVLLDPFEASRVAPVVEHLFTLLSLAVGPELMAATLRSLYGGDAHLRGTALEYLQTTLPDSLRVALWPHIPGATNVEPPRRSSEQIADELMQTSTALRLTREP